MELKDYIYKRKSSRSYTGEPVDNATLNKIRDFVSSAKPLYPDIRVRMDIVEKNSVRCFLPWVTPQLIAVYSEEKDGFLENAGFIFQQLELYLHSLGLGVCWLGLGRMNAGDLDAARKDGMKFIIMLAFGPTKGSPYRTTEGFKRKPLSAIADYDDKHLEAARLAPSSVNSQPWYFTHDDSCINIYCSLQGLFKNKFLGDMNRVDIGIALAHIYVSNQTSFNFFRQEAVPELKGFAYMGSFSL